MLYGKLVQSSQALLHRTRAQLYIYLRGHNQDITPDNSRLTLSYAKPANLVPDAPKQPTIAFKLDPELEELLERQIFEEYKRKVLHGTVDEVKEKEPDPLWGEEPIPVHYFTSLSKVNLMAVPHPQRLDIENSLNQIYTGYFASQFSQEITRESIAAAEIKEIAELSLKARSDNANGQLWFAIEEKLGRGNKLYLLSPEELIKLKYAFDGHVKYGTPLFHEILASLLKEDIPKMDANQLVHLFFACRHSNSGFTNLQPEVLQALKPLYSQFTFQQKVDFLLAFTLSTKPLKFQKKVHKRRKHEFRELAASVLFRLNFWEMDLTDDSAAKLIFSLAKLRIPNTKFITIPLLEYLENHFESYTANRDQLFQAVVYLPELENGEGLGDQAFMARLKEVALSRWEEFNKIEQIRLIHSFWNYGLMDEGLLELYKAIQLQADCTLLFYACQIELHTSSEREWLIIQLSVLLEHIPLPYYPAYRRFYNYIKSTTEWNLTPLFDKLRNTEYYYNVMRLYDTISEAKPYKALRAYEVFTSVRFAELGCPIENLQLAHFAFPIHQVSLDIVTKKEYIPGTTQFKQTFMNKVRSLKNMGWKHLAFSEDQLKEIPLLDFIKNIQDSYLPYVEEQKAVIDYAEYQRAEEVENYKLLRIISDLDIKYLNRLQALGDGSLEEEQDEIDPYTGEKKKNTLLQLERQQGISVQQVQSQQ